MNRQQLFVRASCLALLAGTVHPAIAQSQDQSGRPTAGKKKPPKPAKPLPPAPTAAPGSQTAPDDSGKSASPDTTAAGDVVVTGVRSSLATAREKKRTSDAIVDVVEAEDIGKLPNNTIGDVIAMVPGINAFRREGEVDNFQLRGMTDTQTTIGGTPIESGSARTASIADLPADLVKSVEVYKTRTPDQVEGAGSGSINIELRKPSEFKAGLVGSFNFANRYNTQSRRHNRVVTGMLNYRHDTNIGNFGIMVSGTINYNPFLDSRANNDTMVAVSTRQVVGPQILPFPTYGPGQTLTEYRTGSRRTPSLNGAIQWAKDGDSIVLEATYSKPTFDRYDNEMFLPILTSGISTNQNNALPSLTNITLVPGTNRIASVTASPTTQIGPIANLNQNNTTQYLYKATAQHSDDSYILKSEIAFTGSDQSSRTLALRNRFVGRPVFDVVFGSTKYKYPISEITVRDLDILDINQYRFFGVTESGAESSNNAVAIRTDLTLLTHRSFLPKLQFGVRVAKSNRNSFSGSRAASNLQLELSQIPGGFGDLIPIDEGFAGTNVGNPLRWLGYKRSAAREDYDELRKYLTPLFPAFATERPADTRSGSYEGGERSIAAYATIHYKARLLFPISGILGARVTNWINRNQSFWIRGATTNLSIAESNQINVEPTLTAVVNYTTDFKSRFSYNYAITRPSATELTPFISFSETGFTATAGNPNLQPRSVKKFDISFEYYFGKTGILSFNPFYWKTSGEVFRYTLLEDIEGISYQVSRPQNAGRGYRRGFEAQAQLFFTFLPGFLKSFGVSSNYTYTESRQTYPPFPGALNNSPAELPLEELPKHLFNVSGLFERGTLNARVGFSYRGTMLDNRYSPVEFSSYFIPLKWMDAAINYSIPSGPLKNLGFSVQAQNILGSARQTFYGYYDTPRDTWFNARTYGGTVRYKF